VSTVINMTRGALATVAAGPDSTIRLELHGVGLGIAEKSAAAAANLDATDAHRLASELLRRIGIVPPALPELTFLRAMANAPPVAGRDFTRMPGAHEEHAACGSVVGAGCCDKRCGDCAEQPKTGGAK
jgi:hypothetical protein